MSLMAMVEVDAGVLNRRRGGKVIARHPAGESDGRQCPQ